MASRKIKGLLKVTSRKHQRFKAHTCKLASNSLHLWQQSWISILLGCEINMEKIAHLLLKEYCCQTHWKGTGAIKQSFLTHFLTHPFHTFFNSVHSQLFSGKRNHPLSNLAGYFPLPTPLLYKHPLFSTLLSLLFHPSHSLHQWLLVSSSGGQRFHTVPVDRLLLGAVITGGDRRQIRIMGSDKQKW